MKLNLIQAFQTASSKLMGTSFLYFEKIDIRKVVERLPHCGSPSIESIFIRTNHFQMKMVYFVCISSLPPPNFNKGDIYNFS